MSYGARADISTPSFPPQTRPAIPVGFLGYSKPRLAKQSISRQRDSFRGDSRIFRGWIRFGYVDEMNRSTGKKYASCSYRQTRIALALLILIRTTHFVLYFVRIIKVR